MVSLESDLLNFSIYIFGTPIISVVVVFVVHRLHPVTTKTQCQSINTCLMPKIAVYRPFTKEGEDKITGLEPLVSGQGVTTLRLDRSGQRDE